MYDDEQMIRIFRTARVIAVYGMSSNPLKAAHTVPAYFSNKGYEIIPVNPHAGDILGLRCHRSLHTIERHIDLIDVFRPSSEVVQVVQEALTRREARGDVDALWLQSGIIDEESCRLAENAGIVVIRNSCMLTEYLRLLVR